MERTQDRTRVTSLKGGGRETSSKADHSSRGSRREHHTPVCVSVRRKRRRGAVDAVIREYFFFFFFTWLPGGEAACGVDGGMVESRVVTPEEGIGGEGGEKCDEDLVKGEDPGADVIQQPVHADDEILSCDGAAPDDPPVVGLDGLEIEILQLNEGRKWRKSFQAVANNA